MTLHLHRAPRTDLLADALGDLLAVPLEDPFVQEVVVVPARGVERWLTQRLSHRLGAGPRGGDGVCAGVRFLNPRSLVSLLLDRERDDPWDPDRLVWPLLETIDASLDEPWLATLASHLGHGRTGDEAALRRDRRYSVARRLAGLLASYAVQRPQLVRDWREGRDTDGSGGALPADLLWQAELWRRLLARVQVEPPDVRHDRAVGLLRAGGAAALDLPERLSLFGHTRLPVTEVDLLDALAGACEVHLWLPQPSPALWDDLRGLGVGGVVARDADTSAERVRHPLLASLGRDARELSRTLAPVACAEVALDEPVPDRSRTLLGWLQADLRANRVPDAARRARRVHDEEDRSLQVHACHGPARQVDVLREVLVGLLADHPDLEPRDILVMCPDIEVYAPLISAGFGLADAVEGDATQLGHPAHRLRVRLADRALSSTNPLLAVAASLVELAGGRVTASAVLDLIGTPACRRRFGLGDDDLARIAGWVGQAGIRWGLDGAHRARFEMQGFEHNTWRAGLDRILLGVAMSGDEHRHLGRGLPVDDVASSDVDLVGRLAELLDRLTGCLDALTGASDVGSWMRALGAGVRALTAVDDDDAWQVPQLERELARATASAGGTGADGSGPGVELRLADVRALLATRLGGRPTRASFRTGTLTVCTMVPMRSVPHRVVCLLGLDDGVFPRALSPDGDDVLARHPLTGERDVRSEDRQLLLDALLAATETLVVTYTGANEHSGAARPPAVPLGEILDAADRTASGPVRERVLVRHPLQPYDPRNLVAGALVSPRSRPFSFDAAALAGARAAGGGRTSPPALLDGPLGELAAEDVSLSDLKAFFAHPVRSFLRHRLEVSTPLAPDEVGDAIPVELDQLDVWQVGDRLLRAVLAGEDPTAVMTAEQLRGTLPPGRLGLGALTGVVEEAQRLLVRTADLRTGVARTIDVDVDLGADRRLSGTVSGVHGSRLVTLGYSRLKARQRLTTWIDLLALSASHPDESFTAHAVGRDRAGPKRALAGPLDHRAADWLRTLVELRDRGLRAPLPVPLATAAAWAEGRARELRGDDVSPVELARRAWETDPHHPFGMAGEDADASHQRAYGSERPARAAARGRAGHLCLAGVGAPARRRRAGGPAVTREEPAAFDITAPLPQGTTLLEASAGTGKTWTIGALVARYVAEGVARLEEMLVVTFGRAASQELRERVRAQLVEAERALAGDPQLDVSAQSRLLPLLLDCSAQERELRHRRVVEALAGFDGATIATTHQFCSLVLGSLGVAGDTDARARLVEDLDDLVGEVVDDLYLRAFAYDPAGPAFGHAEALAIARAAVRDPQARLEPAHEDRGTPAGRRVAFALKVREEVDARKRRLGVLSYDDLLSQLAGALAAEDSPARTRMRARWSIVLVDEFQDTDPVQWQVLDRAFTGHATMVLIGDPKQAIYAFRGGDVTTYLAAAASATTRQTLAVNWRSDAGLLGAFQELLVGAELGDERIVVRPVDAQHAGSRLHGAPRPAPLRMRVVRREAFGRSSRSTLTIGQVRPYIARDLALDVRRLLASGATFEGRPLEPRDVAVISYRHADLAAARQALHEVGVPAVIAGGGSVFATPAAVEWLTLLEALEQPHRSARARAAALTCFVGHSARELDEGGERLTDEVADRLRSWAEAAGRRGIAAVLEAATAAGLPGRVLAEVGGERRLTDLRHLGEALHEAAQSGHLGLVALLGWLREQVATGREGRGAERTRRLDSDAAAVQLVTIHASKGLEYPVVYLPALGDRHVPKPLRPLFHDDEGRRCLAVGSGADVWDDQVARWSEEEAGEWLRLLYVAVTRAQSQVVCWWAPTKNAVASPLHRLLVRAPDQGAVPAAAPVPSDDAVVELFARWRDRGGPAPEPAVPADAGDDPPRPPTPDLSVRRFERDVDLTWRRTSYSALSHVEAAPGVSGVTGVAGTSGALSDGVTSEPEVVATDDEDLADLPVTPEARPDGTHPAAQVPSPMAGLPVGAAFGSLVHAVLEHADPEAPDLREELLGHIDEQRVWWPVDLDRDELADALVSVCDTPLFAEGSPEGRTTLREVPLRDRLRELDFELPLAGGDLAGADPDDGGGPVRLGDLAPLLRRHLPDGDPVRGYADALEVPALGGQSLRGYLTGSVDVVLRLGARSAPRYLIVDYKTNWLGPRDEPLTAHAYRPAALDEAMAHSDYPLQALLYAVVLHRFLRWRQPGYDPEVHLGGVLYLYLRGLCGPDAPLVDGRPCGVFTWRPPVALLEELSDLLDGRRVPA